MARPVAINFLDRNLVGESQLCDRRACFLSCFHPLIHVARCRQCQYRIGAQRGERCGHFIDQLLQRLAPDLQIVEIRNFLGHAQIELGLRFVRIGNG